MKLFLQDIFRTFLAAFVLLAFLAALVLAMPGITQVTDDAAEWSGAQPGTQVEYELLNTLPPTHDHE